MQKHNLVVGMVALCFSLGLIALTLRPASRAIPEMPRAAVIEASTINSSPVDVFQDSDVATVVSAPLAASVLLTKTVGTDPGVCAAAKTITLPVGGGDVYYCFQVSNTGTITLTQHTLTDDHMGTILSNFPFTLVPGASAFLTQTATITTTTVNAATWTAFKPGPIDVASDSDTATVNVTPSAPAILLSKTVGTNPHVCAATEAITLTVSPVAVTYCYTVRNTGNVTLTQHTLTDDHMGTILSNFPFTLVPGASAFLTQTATITTTTVNAATWTAFKPGPIDVASDSDTATASIIRHVYLPVVFRASP